ncbi:hypothetical protein H6P81_016101 [Aristolochia fimbriata]|uniref:Alanyl-transfer RNA synthetases family profile domain-containing protein n=1 Tax=Aristolochia fimbriata TaxID=158543 RepID=A0AAV7EA89_ARIFI|nr:hypothetical protein H6P81_016101 [Aristolochia fimbriata]
MDSAPTKIAYFDDMWLLQSTAKLVSQIQTEDGRQALILDSTIFYPQGGGQPSDTGFISDGGGNFKFFVEDVRMKDGIVFHYGKFDASETFTTNLQKGQEFNLYVDELKLNLHSRLHSAGHLLDICMQNVGLAHLGPGKGYHFSDGPFVEYKGTIPQNEVQSKQEELEREANALISEGVKVSAAVLPYEQASEMCGGSLPSYISKDSIPRIVKFGNYPGCPCGGTHVGDVAEIRSIKQCFKSQFSQDSHAMDPEKLGEGIASGFPGPDLTRPNPKSPGLNSQIQPMGRV